MSKHNGQAVQPLPKRKFELHAVVVVPKRLGYEYGTVLGYEWGSNLRNIRRECWVYYVRQSDKDIGEMQHVTEEELIACPGNL